MIAMMVAAMLAAQEAPATPMAAVAPAGPQAAAPAPEKQICHTEDEVNSRIRKNKVCHTASEWKALYAGHRDMAAEWRNTPGATGGR